jgi:hypothetical protein
MNRFNKSFLVLMIGFLLIASSLFSQDAQKIKNIPQIQR